MLDARLRASSRTITGHGIPEMEERFLDLAAK
jgi:hypothetical protein